MKQLIFDAGPIISLTTNNLLWILEELKRKNKVEFFIPKGVKHEIVDSALETRRFKFEGLQVQRLIDIGVLKVIEDEEVTKKSRELLEITNKILSGHGNPIKIMQVGEMETIAAALLYEADAICVDERITRTILENPKGLQKLMEKRLHMQLNLNDKALHEFGEKTRHITLIRSIELATIAFEQGILNKYLVEVAHPRKALLESILWGLKLNGASVTDDEINLIVKSA